MALIELHGKYAVGDAKFAIVDTADFAELNAFRWRARPGRNTVYASRTYSKRSSGRKRNGQIQMHREILGLVEGDGIEVDHINHNGLDNQKNNLRRATKSVNQRNRITRAQAGVCSACGKEFAHKGKAGRPHKYCGGPCKSFAPVSLRTPVGQRKATTILTIMTGRFGNKEIAKRSGLSMPAVWRLLPQLVSAGKLHLVQSNPNLYELAAGR